MKGLLLLYNLKLNCLIFCQSKQLTDYIYTDIYCKLSKCIGQTHVRMNIILLFLFFHFYLLTDCTSFGSILSGFEPTINQQNHIKTLWCIILLINEKNVLHFFTNYTL